MSSRIIALYLILPFSAFLQTTDVNCDESFSNKKDSYFCNYYIDAKGDSTYYCSNPCVMVQGINNPKDFRRSFKSGFANGDYRVYEKNKDYVTIIEAAFRDGYISQGSVLEFYSSKKKHMSGQYFEGKPFGIWLYYYPNGNLEKMVTYNDEGKIDHLREYNTKGVLTKEKEY